MQIMGRADVKHVRALRFQHALQGIICMAAILSFVFFGPVPSDVCGGCKLHTLQQADALCMHGCDVPAANDCSFHILSGLRLYFVCLLP